MSYAGLEFEYLIERPQDYRFFRKAVNDINLDALKDIRAKLTADSAAVLGRIFDQLQLPELMNIHLSFILKGYNELYTAGMGDED